MINVKLNRILAKEENKSLLEEYLVPFNETVYVEDLLIRNIGTFGKGELKGDTRYSVFTENGKIGWVKGGSAAKAVSSLLCYMANSEYEKKMLAQETLERYKELNCFYEFSEMLAECRSNNEITRLCANEVSKHIQFNDMIVLLKREGKRELDNVYEYIPKKSPIPYQAYNKIFDAVLNNSQAEIINALNTDERCLKFSQTVKSMMCAPLSVKNRTTGILALFHYRENAYKSDDLKFFNSISFQVSVALENSSLFEMQKETFFETVKTLSETIEKRNLNVAGHSKRVMDYCMRTGQILGLIDVDMARLKLSAMMHDIGMIGVPDRVLLKTGRFTAEEYEVMKKHSIYGADIIQNINQLRDIVPGVKYHHEEYNGGGYPEGLKGDKIPLIGRIIAVADAYDAMTSDRPYRPAMKWELAIAELVRYAGSQFDPEIVKVFLQMLKIDNKEKGISNE